MDSFIDLVFVTAPQQDDELPALMTRVRFTRAPRGAFFQGIHFMKQSTLSSHRAFVMDSNQRWGSALCAPRLLTLPMRSGGEHRRCDSLWCRYAHTALFFLAVLRPDTTPDLLYQACADSVQRDRRFGGISIRVSA